MRVLVVESDPSGARHVVNQLRSAGHKVVRCHEDGLPAFPCNGITSGACPVEAGCVDVAVTVREHVHPSPTALEDGMTCAIRHQVPLVLVGPGALNPFERYGIREVADASKVVRACEVAQQERNKAFTSIACEEARRVCTAFAVDTTDMGVEATAQGGDLHVIVDLPAEPHRFDTAIQAGLRDELKAQLPWLRSITILLSSDRQGRR